MPSFSVRKKDVRFIVDDCFPEYRGRRFEISTNIPLKVDQYWDGGTRSSWKFYELATGRKYDVQDNHPWFESGRPRDLGGKLPTGVVLVRHLIFCGKDAGITIYANAGDLTPLLPRN